MAGNHRSASDVVVGVQLQRVACQQQHSQTRGRGMRAPPPFLSHSLSDAHTHTLSLRQHSHSHARTRLAAPPSTRNTAPRKAQRRERESARKERDRENERVTARERNDLPHARPGGHAASRPECACSAVSPSLPYRLGCRTRDPVQGARFRNESLACLVSGP